MTASSASSSVVGFAPEQLHQREMFARIARMNQEVKKKFGVPLCTIMPTAAIGQAGAALASVPEGYEAVVDILTQRVVYVRLPAQTTTTPEAPCPSCASPPAASGPPKENHDPSTTPFSSPSEDPPAEVGT